jgi:carbamoyltransferase
MDALLGPSYDVRHIKDCLDLAGVEYQDFSGRESELLRATAAALADGSVVGWFQGPMEFGPRALGARSIWPTRGPQGWDHINAPPQRESFRPFAPAVPEDRCAEFFERDLPAPFMLETALVRDRDALPAITHVDGSARLQTVSQSANPLFYRLLNEFGQITGYPVLLNTSFNIRGEPIVCDPTDALVSFIRCRLDVLVLGDLMISRADVPASWAIAERARPFHPPSVSSNVYTLF